MLDWLHPCWKIDFKGVLTIWPVAMLTHTLTLPCQSRNLSSLWINSDADNLSVYSGLLGKNMEMLRETGDMNFPPPYSVDAKPHNQQLQSTVVQVVQPPVIRAETPQEWMTISIINCLCCCLFLVVLAIIMSANSRNAAQIGEITVWNFLAMCLQNLTA